MTVRLKYVIIGSGNLAWQMAIRLKAQKQNILQVYSRKLKNARLLATKIKTKHTSSLNRLDKTADVYLIAVSDDAIEEVAKKIEYLEGKRKLFIHTSGSIAGDVLAPYFKQYAVLWPPQSISKVSKIDFSKVPLCICAPTHSSRKAQKVAKVLSKKTYVINEDQKKALHLACVFANNFSNHMIHLAQSICIKNKLEFKILEPIITETFAKVLELGPVEAQTGPASREDEKAIKAHLKYLSKDKEMKKIYKLISESIISKN